MKTNTVIRFIIILLLFVAVAKCNGQSINLQATATVTKAFKKYVTISDTAQTLIVVTDEPGAGVFRQMRMSAKAYRAGVLLWETKPMQHGGLTLDYDAKYFFVNYIKPKL